MCHDKFNEIMGLLQRHVVAHASDEQWSPISVLSHGSLTLENLLVDASNSCWITGYRNSAELPFFEDMALVVRSILFDTYTLPLTWKMVKALAMASSDALTQMRAHEWFGCSSIVFFGLMRSICSILSSNSEQEVQPNGRRMSNPKEFHLTDEQYQDEVVKAVSSFEPDESKRPKMIRSMIARVEQKFGEQNIFVFSEMRGKKLYIDRPKKMIFASKFKIFFDQNKS